MRLAIFRLTALCVLTFLLASCSNYRGFPAVLQKNKCLQGNATAQFPLKTKWCRELELPITGTPKAYDGVLYVRTSDNLSKVIFYAVDVETSNVIWQFDTSVAMGEPFYHWNVIGDYLIVSGLNKVQAMNRHTGQTVWQTSIPSLSGEVIAGSQNLFVITTGSVFCMSTSEGKVLWEFKGLPSHRTFRGFFIPASSVIVVPADKYYVVDAVSGRLSYSGDYDFLAGPISAVPYQNKIIYGNMMVEVANGKVVENLPGGNTDIMPLVDSDLAYYIADLRKLVSWDLVRGKTNWVYATDTAIKSSPAIYNDQIYVLTGDDKLRAISLKRGLETGQWYGPQSSETLRPTGGDNYVPPSGLISSPEGLYLSLGTNLLYAFEAP